ncbi:hypothetical protein OHA25_08115 [Nonomuraea sp. NBC_00507]|uniref:hypothetical protein n=1 Tax=Nonomuraea sp. NBC_00507 TaxID=2976002 RepID=UPI002E194F7A
MQRVSAPTMPSAARAAQAFMWAETALALTVAGLFVWIMDDVGRHPAAVVALTTGIALYAVAVTMLTWMFSTRRHWVRVTACILQTVLIVVSGLGLLQCPSMPMVFALALATLTLWQLCTTAATAWFSE